MIEFNSGSDLIDLVVGGGLFNAYPAGKIINIVGDKSTGKTFFACELIAAARAVYKNKFKWVYDDCESGFTHNTEYIYGFSIIPENKKEIIKSKNVQELMCNFTIFLESLKRDDCGIYVVDSLDGLRSKEQQERTKKRLVKFKKGQDLDKGSYQMEKQKFLSQEFFPGTADSIQVKNCLLVVISQTRCVINSLFKEQDRSGGKAMDFYAYCCLWLSKVKDIKKNGLTIGLLIKALSKKLKAPRPYRSCIVPVYFEYGIDNIGGNLDFLFDLRGENFKLLKMANNISWEGDIINKYGITELKNFLKDHDLLELYNEYLLQNNIILKGRDEKRNSIIEYIKENAQSYMDEFNKIFGIGKTFTRDELIKYIEDNNLQDELTKRVKEKWERIESSVKIERKRKYE